MRSLILKAPAKVNLGLWVGKKRPDGFHEIITIIVPVALFDQVVIRVRPLTPQTDVVVTTDSPLVPDGTDNLAHKAASAFFDATGINADCRIHIRKRVPVGAGLGGGSSDAAAVLRGLSRLFRRPLSPTRLMALARGIGSDVPALLLGRACVARGRGERLNPIALPRLNLMLHLPGYAVPTAQAYAALDRLRARQGVSPQRHKGSDESPLPCPSASALTEPVLSPKILAARLRRGELERAACLVRNGFEPVVFRTHPDLARAKRLLLENGCFAAALSGSGSTVYGLMEKARQDPMAALKRQGLSCIRTRSI